MLDFRRFEALTFDCYGTLIDWETGILAAVRPAFSSRRVTTTDDEMLEGYARHEASLEQGKYRPYRDVLGRAFTRLCTDCGFAPTAREIDAFADSVGSWPAFPDSPAALARLAARFKLGVITNCDDDLFARSNARLGVTFDWIVTAQQVGSYKPSLRNFEHAFDAMNVPRDRILHVAQSLYHDHVPAKRLGLSTVWIDRRGGKTGLGPTPPATAAPDVTMPDLITFADLAVRSSAR